MRVAINTLSVTDANEGIRTMVVGLVNALVRRKGDDSYRLICSRANEHIFTSVADGVAMTVLAEPRHRLVRIFHDQVTVPWLVRHDADVLLTPSTVGTLFSPVPQVVVMPAGLALRSVRGAVGRSPLTSGHQLYYGPVMRLSHRRTQAVVPISHFLADRLAADTGLSPAKIHVIPCGVDPIPSTSNRQGSRDEGQPYMLFVGALYPYKGVDTLVRALATAGPRLPDRFRAIIAGRDPDGTQTDAIRRLAHQLGVEERIVLTGKVSEPELERLYAGATLLVFPSRAESFGFPVLEAMARGIPVIAANRTALPEVVGDAGVLVDPDRTEMVAEAIVAVVGDVAFQDRLAEAGKARAAQFSWDQAASAFIALFGRLANRSATPDRRPHH